MDNPKPAAELSMLKQYGPDVPDATLRKLVAVFGELRSMADQGTITYPYSVREVVSIVKHLQVRSHSCSAEYRLCICFVCLLPGCIYFCLHLS